jgi:hypothetical protein
MKTAEQIVRHHLTADQIDWLNEDKRNMKFIVDAMEEYAEQQVKKDLIAGVGETLPTDEEAETIATEIYPPRRGKQWVRVLTEAKQAAFVNAVKYCRRCAKQ